MAKLRFVNCCTNKRIYDDDVLLSFFFRKTISRFFSSLLDVRAKTPADALQIKTELDSRYSDKRKFERTALVSQRHGTMAVTISRKKRDL